MATLPKLRMLFPGETFYLIQHTFDQMTALYCKIRNVMDLAQLQPLQRTLVESPGLKRHQNPMKTNLVPVKKIMEVIPSRKSQV